MGFNNTKKKVAIIGAGPAGLCSAKSAIENELHPTIFEKSDSIGGVWSSKNGKMWDTMTINTSKYVMSFSDYLYEVEKEDPTEDDTFVSYKSYFKYLNDYANKFDVIKYIRFNSNVINIKRINNGESIKITWLDSSNGNNNNINQLKEESFDYLIIASGMFSKPQECSLVKNELKEFTGKITHSQDYKNIENYKEKNIVVVGTSISGCEISAEISEVTNKCIIVGHENLFVYDKYLPNYNGNGKLVPWDLPINNRNNVYTNLNLPLNKFNQIKKKSMELYCPLQIKEITPNSKILVEEMNSSGSNNYGYVNSSKYVNKVEDESITVYTGNNFRIISSLGNSITFSNDIGEIYTQDNIDEVILCNGYQCDLSYLDKSIQNEISYKPDDSIQPMLLYKNIFSPNLNNIAFVSCFRGLFISEVELLSRWACLVFSGKKSFPTETEFKNGIKSRKPTNCITSPLPTTTTTIPSIPQFIVSGSTYHCDNIALEIGCLPNFEELKIRDPQLYDILWNGYYITASYRLVGHGSNVVDAKNILLKVNSIYKQYQ